MVTAAVLGLLASGAVFADAGADLAKAKNCLTCHSVDKKIVGPAYKDVAAKYKGDASAEAKLIEKVKKGGSGVWGPVPMPPNSPQVSDADIKQLVEWVLSQK
ncbi:MAG: c-type cytochrome [Betaproteobacteria bacterium]|nr:c-type cytochrome [Betaproteobacteria bacterium]